MLPRILEFNIGFIYNFIENLNDVNIYYRYCSLENNTTLM